MMLLPLVCLLLSSRMQAGQLLTEALHWIDTRGLLLNWTGSENVQDFSDFRHRTPAQPHAGSRLLYSIQAALISYRDSHRRYITCGLVSEKRPQDGNENQGSGPSWASAGSRFTSGFLDANSELGTLAGKEEFTPCSMRGQFSQENRGWLYESESIFI